MALRRIAHNYSFRLGASWLSSTSPTSVHHHTVSITIIDKDGLRHVVKGVEGQYLHDVLAFVLLYFLSGSGSTPVAV